MQQQLDQAADLQELQEDLKLTRRQLIELDKIVAHGDQLLRQHLTAVFDPLQQLMQQQQQRQQLLDHQSADLQQQLNAMQQQLLDALTRLMAPKKVTITRDKNRKIIGAEVG